MYDSALGGSFLVKMNVGQVSPHRKFQWCGAANLNTHGCRKERLTLQNGGQKQPPSAGRLAPDLLKHPYNHGIAAISAEQHFTNKDGFCRYKCKMGWSESWFKYPLELTSGSGSACVIRMHIDIK
jgi:hypothetical protein